MMRFSGKMLALVLALLSFAPIAAAEEVMPAVPALPSLAPMLRGATPAVVNLAAVGPLPGADNPFLGEPRVRQFLSDPRLRRYFGLPADPESARRQSIGSGVIVDAEHGYLLTNYHLVEQAERIQATLTDGRSLPALLVGFDAANDLAVLKAEAEGLTALPWGAAGNLEVGDFVVAIGNPFGIGQTVTLGIVSALRRRGPAGGDFIQTDASINPGNSGGALIDLRGRLVGINSALIGPTGASVGIGLAIPAERARFLMARIVAYDEWLRQTLGIAVADGTPQPSRTFGRPAPAGAEVLQLLIEEDQPFRVGDRIVAVDGRTILNAGTLRSVIAAIPPGTTVEVTLEREKRSRTVTVTLRAPQD